MTPHPIFLSIILVLRNNSEKIEEILTELSSVMENLVSDYELVIVDNASDDDSLMVLKQLTQENGLANLQIYALTKQVDADTASWAGIECALGDFVAVLDPFTEDISILSGMLEKAAMGADVVFARNDQRPAHGIVYQLACSCFHNIYGRLTGTHLAKEAPQYRMLSRKVVNYILKHSQPAIGYRHLPATAGFSRAYLSYSSAPRAGKAKRLRDSLSQGIYLLISTTHAPMRLVTSLSLLGAIANLLYSGYVLAVGLFQADVAPGWTSLSLQQSGMFFLLSLSLLMLGEYILHVTRLSNSAPLYHVAQEFNSTRLSRQERLNVEEEATLPSGRDRDGRPV
ncbi:glycosyltransferase [Pseudomonas resinovorans]|uniref:glycosyltransferase n=1 Tax=Metapseudomonas resinovorans TaxID=53412 RepID=UPI00237F45F0|nr:glycosyltransferase [Pseudomonas resinovorans]MDE3739659.1 glycosyltransferase [Pseudomonas resinovorans]